MVNNNNIAEIEKALGFPLPGAYRDFLLKEQAEDDLPVTDLVLLYGTAQLLRLNAEGKDETVMAEIRDRVLSTIRSQS